MAKCKQQTSTSSSAVADLHCYSSPQLHLTRPQHPAATLTWAKWRCAELLPFLTGPKGKQDFLEAVNPVWVRAYLHGRPLGADGIKHTSACWCFNASRWKTADPAWLTAPGVFLLAGRTKDKHNKAPGCRKYKRTAGKPNQRAACLSRFPLIIGKLRRL